MRAKFINEKLTKFTEDGDPIKDMGVGWNIKREIEKRLHDAGDPITYKEFMEEFLDRYANQDSLGIFGDVNRVIHALVEENKHQAINDTFYKFDEDDEFTDKLINMQMELLSKLSVEKQLEWYEPILEHYLDLMNH